MSEAEVVSAVLAAGGVCGVLYAVALIMKNLPAVLDSLHSWHVDIKRLRFLRHQFDQTGRTEANVYLYPPESQADAKPEQIEPKPEEVA